MKRSAAFRFTSDICFYYAILSIFPALSHLHRPMALFAAASFAASLAAICIPWAPLRFVLALLPGLAFLPAKLSFSLVFPALAWLYLILVLTAGRFNIWLEGYRSSYRIMLAICVFSVISSILLNLIKPGILLFLPSMYYLMASFCLSVIAMRQMQMNTEMSLRWKLLNGAAAVGVPLLAGAVSLLLWKLLLLLKPLGLSLLPLLKRFIVLLINAINSLFLSDTEMPEPTETPTPTLTPAERAIVEPGWVTPTPNIRFGRELDPAVFEALQRFLVAALFVLLVIALLLLILRRARHNRAKSVLEEFSFDEAEEDVLLRRRKKAERVSDGSNARQIRICYRKYMLLMRKRGVKIQAGSTSQDILDEADQISLSPDARTLRRLYLKARYKEDGTITREDVQEAQNCLNEILKDDSWKK